VPATAFAFVETLNLAVPEELIEAGLKEAEVPAGNPLAVRDSVPVNPSRAAMFTVKFVLCPMANVCVFGVVEIEKSAVLVVLVIARLNVVLCTSVPLVPVRVSV
jgi:hypothetical protein